MGNSPKSENLRATPLSRNHHDPLRPALEKEGQSIIRGKILKTPKAGISIGHLIWPIPRISRKSWFSGVFFFEASTGKISPNIQVKQVCQKPSVLCGEKIYNIQAL